MARYANHSGKPNLAVELRPFEDDDDAAGGGGDGGGSEWGLGTDMGVALTTLRDVAAGEELTFDYGEE